MTTQVQDLVQQSNSVVVVIKPVEVVATNQLDSADGFATYVLREAGVPPLPVMQVRGAHVVAGEGSSARDKRDFDLLLPCGEGMEATSIRFDENLIKGVVLENGILKPENPLHGSILKAWLREIAAERNSEKKLIVLKECIGYQNGGVDETVMAIARQCGYEDKVTVQTFAQGSGAGPLAEEIAGYASHLPSLTVQWKVEWPFFNTCTKSKIDSDEAWSNAIAKGIRTRHVGWL